MDKNSDILKVISKKFKFKNSRFAAETENLLSNAKNFLKKIRPNSSK